MSFPDGVVETGTSEIHQPEITAVGIGLVDGVPFEQHIMGSLEAECARANRCRPVAPLIVLPVMFHGPPIQLNRASLER